MTYSHSLYTPSNLSYFGGIGIMSNWLFFNYLNILEYFFGYIWENILMNIMLKDKGKEVEKRKGEKEKKKKNPMSAFIVMWHDLPRLPYAHNYRASQLLCCEWYLDVLKILLLSAQDSGARRRASQAPRWSSYGHWDSLLTLVFYTMLLCCALSHVRLFATPWTVAHQGPLSSRVIMPSSRESSQPRDWTCISCFFCIAGRFFTTEPPENLLFYVNTAISHR